MKDWLPAPLCKLRPGEFVFKELDDLLSDSYPGCYPLSHNADAKKNH